MTKYAIARPGSGPDEYGHGPFDNLDQALICGAEDGDTLYLLETDEDPFPLYVGDGKLWQPADGEGDPVDPDNIDPETDEFEKTITMVDKAKNLDPFKEPTASASAIVADLGIDQDGDEIVVALDVVELTVRAELRRGGRAGNNYDQETGSIYARTVPESLRVHAIVPKATAEVAGTGHSLGILGNVARQLANTINGEARVAMREHLEHVVPGRRTEKPPKGRPITAGKEVSPTKKTVGDSL